MNPQPSLSLDLPIQYQTLTVDIEPVAQLRQFGADSYDVANWTGTIAVNHQTPEPKEYRLVLPFATEAGTTATVRTISSSDADFDQVYKFKKPTGSPEQFIPYLIKMGLAPEGTTKLTEELRSFVKGFKVADVLIPAGPQILRLNASQKLLPISDDKRSYELILYAPLCNFVLGGGQTNLTILVSFPPDFQVPTLAIGTPVEEALPGQPTPQLVGKTDAPVQVVNHKILSWHWRNDPKITIPYKY